jgi:glutathione S-transferase
MTPSPSKPLMITIPVSPFCELARWTLDRLEVPYVEHGHVPMFHLLATRMHHGGAVVPVLDTGAGSLTDARQVLDHYDQRAPERLRLFPADPTEQADARQLFDRFFDHLAVAVRAWAYAYMLPDRTSTSRVWCVGVPMFEQVAVRALFPLVAGAVHRELHLGPGSIAEQEPVIEAIFGEVDARLADGRRYLVADRLTAADMAFASLAAPAVIPPEYGGPMPTVDELPPTMRAEVERLRSRPAGRFLLRLYREDR